MSTSDFKFEPIAVNANAPGGACILETFDDIATFILTKVDIKQRIAPHWAAVRRDLIQARFGARRMEVHQATCRALMEEGWLA